VDLMLSLFPFESEFLERHGVPVRYVGHPLASEIPLEPDRDSARSRLGLERAGTLIALLPGSRADEVRALGPRFIGAANWCLQQRPDLRFVVPLVNATVRGLFEEALAAGAPDLPIALVDGNSRDVLEAADLVLTASGTATLEAMLYKRPMVVGYRLHPLSYRIYKILNLVKIPHVAMANLLAGEELAPELLQEECRPESLGAALLEFLEHPERMAEIRARYLEIHRGMRLDAADRAAQAVLELIGAEKGNGCG
jgi:lipid-A-disaccharide synthase